MKKLFLCAAAVLAAVAVGGCWGRNPISAAAENKSIDVYLIGGQSNAVGYGYDRSRGKRLHRRPLFGAGI